MKKLLLGLVSFALTTASMRAAENFRFDENSRLRHVLVGGMQPRVGVFSIKLINNTPYNIQHDMSMPKKGSMRAVALAFRHGDMDINADATEFPTFDVLSDDGDVMFTIVPYLANGALKKPIFQEGDAIVINHYTDGSMVVMLNDMVVPFRVINPRAV